MAENRKQQTLQIIGNIKHTITDSPSPIGCIEYTEMFEYIVAGCVDGALRMFKDKKLISTLKDGDIQNTKVTGMKHRPVSKNYPISSSFICTYFNGMVKCWNYDYQACTFTLNENRHSLGVAFHPKLAKFVTIGDDMKIYLYDEDSQRQERVLSSSEEKNANDGHKASITSVCFHPKSGNELISSGLDNTIQFWDIRQPHALRKIDGVKITGEGLDFSQSGTEFVACCNQSEKPLRIFDYGSGKELKTLEPDKYKNMMLTCGRYVTKTSVACAGIEPNLLRVIDVSNVQNIATMLNLPSPVGNISMGQDSSGNHVLPTFAFCAGNQIYEVSAK